MHSINQPFVRNNNKKKINNDDDDDYDAAAAADGDDDNNNNNTNLYLNTVKKTDGSCTADVAVCYKYNTIQYNTILNS